MKPELEQKLMERFPTHLSELKEWNGFIQCENGWFVILWMFLQAIESTKVDVRFWYIKEKFGQLRFGVAPNQMPFEEYALPQEIWDLMDVAQMQSLETCELCGNNGRIRWQWTWIRTLCDTCELSYHHISRPRDKAIPDEIKAMLLPRIGRT